MTLHHNYDDVGGFLSRKLEDSSEMPIAFTSRTLSDAEKKYSQLEKEALTIVFSVKRFHQYLHAWYKILYLFISPTIKIKLSSQIQC